MTTVNSVYRLIEPARKRSRSQKYIKRLMDKSWWGWPRGVRQLAMQRAGYRCEIVGCNHRACDVHHITYDNLWNENLDDLVVLCRNHHWELHARLIPQNAANDNQLELPLVLKA